MAKPLIQPDPIADAVAQGTHKAVFGLVLAVAAAPVPRELSEFYEEFSARVTQRFSDANVLPDSFMLYEPSALHCTVATLHPFSQPQPLSRERAVAAWGHCIQAATRLASWPRAAEPPVLSIGRPKMHANGVGVLQLEDVLCAVEAMRACLRHVCCSGEPRYAALIQEVEDSGSSTGFLRIPEILHSTVLRWRGAPTVESTVVADLYERAAGPSPDVRFSIPSANLLLEELPYMSRRSNCNSIPLSQQQGV